MMATRGSQRIRGQIQGYSKKPLVGWSVGNLYCRCAINASCIIASARKHTDYLSPLLTNVHFRPGSPSAREDNCILTLCSLSFFRPPPFLAVIKDEFIVLRPFSSSLLRKREETKNKTAALTYPPISLIADSKRH